jgi:hypothetical protein
MVIGVSTKQIFHSLQVDGSWQPWESFPPDKIVPVAHHPGAGIGTAGQLSVTIVSVLYVHLLALVSVLVALVQEP